MAELEELDYLVTIDKLILSEQIKLASAAHAFMHHTHAEYAATREYINHLWYTDVKARHLRKAMATHRERIAELEAVKLNGLLFSATQLVTFKERSDEYRQLGCLPACELEPSQVAGQDDHTHLP